MRAVVHHVKTDEREDNSLKEITKEQWKKTMKQAGNLKDKIPCQKKCQDSGLDKKLPVSKRGNLVFGKILIDIFPEDRQKIDAGFFKSDGHYKNW
jgi:hypothetical protein